jgi:predicted transcriptional regulator
LRPSREPRAPTVTPDMVIRMRMREAAGVLRTMIAREFGVCEATITHHLGPKRSHKKAAVRVRR